MEVFDVSVPIRPGMIIYDGNPGVALERVQAIAAGASANVSCLDLGVHTGTHVDAPLHFLDDGPGSEAIDLEPLIGPAAVVDATAVPGELDGKALSGLDIPPGSTRVLLKTPNGRLWDEPAFSRDFIRLTGSGAAYVVDLGIRAIGIDYLSIGDEEAHRTLLSAGVVPIEGLDLRAVEPGPYRLVCLPLRLEGSDGVPARVVLLRE